MKKILLTLLLLFCFSIILTSDLTAQGIARSKGLGIRTSIWNVTGSPTRISVINETGEAQLSLSCVGFGFYFFSRAYQNWFLELNLGVIGGVQSDVKGVVSSTVDVDAIMPLSLGLRYDFNPVQKTLPNPKMSFIIGETHNRCLHLKIRSDAVAYNIVFLD